MDKSNSDNSSVADPLLLLPPPPPPLLFSIYWVVLLFLVRSREHDWIFVFKWRVLLQNFVFIKKNNLKFIMDGFTRVRKRIHKITYYPLNSSIIYFLFCVFSVSRIRCRIGEHDHNVWVDGIEERRVFHAVSIGDVILIRSTSELLF